jgi:uncharacterized membrane protein YfcA
VSHPEIAVILPIFLLAGLVKGMIGLGLPTVAMGLLGLVMAPVQAAALVVVPSLATNIWQFAIGRQHLALVRRLWPMLAAICLGTWAGAGMLSADANGEATIALGVVLAIYAACGLVSLRFAVAPRCEPWLAPAIGAATGLVTAATGVFVIPAVPYLQALSLNRDELVQALGLSFTVSTIALAAGLADHGAFRPSEIGASLLVLAPALAGMALGQWVRRRVPPETFRRWLFFGLLVLGGHLALRGVL